MDRRVVVFFTRAREIASSRTLCALTQQEYGRPVGVYNVHQLRVSGVQSSVRRHPLEIRLGRVQPRDPAQALDPFAGVTGRVSAQTVSNQVDVFRVQAHVILNGTHSRNINMTVQRGQNTFEKLTQPWIGNSRTDADTGVTITKMNDLLLCVAINIRRFN